MKKLTIPPEFGRDKIRDFLNENIEKGSGEYYMVNELDFNRIEECFLVEEDYKLKLKEVKKPLRKNAHIIWRGQIILCEEK